MELLDQFKYVNRIVSTCKTEEQRSCAYKWAWEWSKRAKENYPSLIPSHDDLFLDVISNWASLNTVNA